MRRSSVGWSLSRLAVRLTDVIGPSLRWGDGSTEPALCLSRKLSQDIMQDAAVHEIFDFVRGVDAAQSVEIEC